MTTAREIINKSLQKIGVLTKNDDMSGDEATDGLYTLNSLLESWSNENLMVYTRQLESFPLTGGQGSYTIGSGGDFNTARPLKIVSAYIRQGTTDYPLSINNTVSYDLKISSKDTDGTPSMLVTDNGNPLSTLNIYPRPTGGMTLFLRSEKPLVNIASLDTDISFPPGWERALIYNLAMEQSTEYGQPIDEATYQISMESKGNIKTNTSRNRPMDSYPISDGQGNVYTGWY